MANDNVNFGFEPSPDDEQATMREILSHLAPKKEDDVRMVAAALKTHGSKLEEVFLEWATPYGRYKAKGLWAKVRPDPDAMTEVIERQIVAIAKKSRFKAISAAIVEAAPSPNWRVKYVLPVTGIAAIYGASASGKSFVSLELAAAIAEGSPFFGYATKPAAVLYVVLEGEGGIRGRVLAWQRYKARTMPEGMRFLLQPFRLNDPQDVAELAAMCPPGCVVFIDTLNRSAPGMDENSSKDMSAVIEGAKMLQRLISGLVVLVAHTGKDGSKGLRGHSSLFAALDAAVLIERNGDARSWRVDKAKDGRDGETHYFRLNVVEVGMDEDGDVMTSCVVVPDSVVPTKGEKPLTANQKMALTSFREAAGMFGGLDEQGNFIGLHLSQWRPVFYRMSPADSDAAKKKAFERARKDLIELGRIEVKNNIYRLSGDTAAIEEKCIAEVLKAERDRATRQRQPGDVSRFASLSLGTTATTPF
ncbi:hypothetical protein DJFAAGMI_04522 [Comamonas sp. PE63]|uniref:AAA family ATPase n=1 Tax=Comamonas brasiliensis TaxID=1812482 RepID=A0ABS5LZP9_9BURK|nr:AAA family ATPase [Comamonas sp. PE63]MBS3021746.1 hypothetical protein [Comamonas sp. PE63]